MRRINEHLDWVKSADYSWVGIFLQGSQNYGMDTEESDVDTKVIVLPSFEDFVLDRKPVSTTHEMEDNKEHVDLKDIRLMFECYRKQNINFVETLFTPYFILNPIYEDLFSSMIAAREKIARYNNYAAVNCMVGMAFEKQKAMEHPYPATMDKIERFGYDPKQLSHALRVKIFYNMYVEGRLYADCLRPDAADYLVEVKCGRYSLEEARSIMTETVNYLKEKKQQYMENQPLVIDASAERTMKDVLVAILKRKFCFDIVFK